VENETTFQKTYTSDSSAGAQVIDAADGAMPTGPCAGIFLRHNTAPRWCGAGGDWLPERGRAVRFASNIDALVYCQALDVRGLLVAFDVRGREVYQLNVESILDVVAQDPEVRSFYESRP
jgi:hypothetical protein